MAEPSRKPETEADIRAKIMAPQVRRHAWINIAGPLCALFLGVFAAAAYLKPIDVLRWMQLTRLGWSGVTQNEIALNDGLMTYFITGGYEDQAPIILIHGLGPNTALVWRGVISPLASGHYKVIAPNLFGFASSDHKQTNYTIGYQAGAIAQMIDQLKLDHVNIIGTDLGADVALYYAVDHPEKVERLILVGGGMFGSRGMAKLKQGMIPNSIESMRTQIEMSFYGMPPLPDFMYQRMMAALAGDLQAQTDMINSIPKDEAHIRSKLGQIFNTLTVIFWGGKDPFYSATEGQALHSALPGSATVVFKTSAAYPQLEHPDDFADSVLFILKQTEGGQ